MNSEEIISIYSDLDDNEVMVLYLNSADEFGFLKKEDKLVRHNEELLIAFNDTHKYYIDTFAVVAIKIFNMKEMIE